MTDAQPYPFPDAAPSTGLAPSSTDTAAVRPPAQDHLPKQSKSDTIAELREKPLGWNILKPVETLRSGEIADTQADLLELFESIGIDLQNPGEHEIETTPAVLRAFGKLGTVLEACATDKEAYAALDTGPGAQGRVADLAMWYIEALGESAGSATS